MRRIRTYYETAATGHDVVRQVTDQLHRLARRLATVRHVLAVASGKGGVGKSAVAANLAAALALRGRRVGALDADLNGPSLARMLGAPHATLRADDDGIEPATGTAGVRLVSMDLLLAGEDAPLRWRQPPAPAGPHGAPLPTAFLWQSMLETGALRELLADVRWGPLDYLVIDAPPGTDRLARLLELVPGLAATLLVTTPSEAARHVVAKSVRLAREAGTRTVALVGNMTAYTCAACGHASPLFHADGVRRLAETAHAPVWAEIPFDPTLSDTTDRGEPAVVAAPSSPAARALAALAARVEAELETHAASARPAHADAGRETHTGAEQEKGAGAAPPPGPYAGPSEETP